MAEFVSLRDVKKIYHMGEVDIAAANGISFDIEKGEFAVVVGPSGAGPEYPGRYGHGYQRRGVDRRAGYHEVQGKGADRLPQG